MREGGAQCVAHMELQAIFGAPDIDAVRHTAVIQLFQGWDTAHCTAVCRAPDESTAQVQQANLSKLVWDE